MSEAPSKTSAEIRAFERRQMLMTSEQLAGEDRLCRAFSAHLRKVLDNWMGPTAGEPYEFRFESDLRFDRGGDRE